MKRLHLTGAIVCAKLLEGRFGDKKETMKQVDLYKKLAFVRQGGDLLKLKNSDIHALQDFALNIKDIDLFDELEEYWTLKNLQKRKITLPKS